jgi:hypothetical protein
VHCSNSYDVLRSSGVTDDSSSKSTSVELQDRIVGRGGLQYSDNDHTWSKKKDWDREIRDLSDDVMALSCVEDPSRMSVKSNYVLSTEESVDAC